MSSCSKMMKNGVLTTMEKIRVIMKKTQGKERTFKGKVGTYVNLFSWLQDPIAHHYK